MQPQKERDNLLRPGEGMHSVSWAIWWEQEESTVRTVINTSFKRNDTRSMFLIFQITASKEMSVLPFFLNLRIHLQFRVREVFMLWQNCQGPRPILIFPVGFLRSLCSFSSHSLFLWSHSTIQSKSTGSLWILILPHINPQSLSLSPTLSSVGSRSHIDLSRPGCSCSMTSWCRHF